MSEIPLSDLYILMIEPSKSQAKYIHRELKAAGITHFDIAADGKSALHIMSQFKPDLVISAMHLPDMPATDLIYAMREDKYLGDVSFMLISSETGFDYLDPLKQAGVTAILPKPFKFEQLKRGLYNTMNMLNPEVLNLGNIIIEDLKVLIVDDSLLARKHIKRVLNGLGIEEILQAEDGIGAVSLLEDHFFDFIVTDYNMPNMDGKALLEHVRTSSNQRSIPVLMVTSEGDKGNLAAVEQAGVSGIFDKPFDSETVRQMIQTILSEV